MLLRFGRSTAIVVLATGLGAASCILITDFDDVSLASSSTVTGAGGAAGGPGAGGTICSADLASDPDNCGECGFTCGGEQCVQGACGRCIDLGTEVGLLDRVVVDGDLLYFVQRGGGAGGSAASPYVRTLPLDFTSDSTPGLNHPIENGVTMATIGTVGTHHVYVTGQCTECMPREPVIIYACAPAECIAFDVGSGHTQINGLTAIGETLYYLSVYSQRLMKVALDPETGVPMGASAPQVTSYDAPGPNAGIVELFHTLDPPRLYWASWGRTPTNDDWADACVFRVDVADLPWPQAIGLPCYSAPFAVHGFAVASDGTVLAEEGPTADVLKIEGDPPPVATVFAQNARFPRSVDDTHLYLADATSGSVRAIPLAGGAAFTDFPTAPDTLYGLDARHPRYVVATAGTHICRWPKPP